jgi:hypothetical protein
LLQVSNSDQGSVSLGGLGAVLANPAAPASDGDALAGRTTPTFAQLFTPPGEALATQAGAASGPATGGKDLPSLAGSELPATDPSAEDQAAHGSELLSLAAFVSLAVPLAGAFPSSLPAADASGERASPQATSAMLPHPASGGRAGAGAVGGAATQPAPEPAAGGAGLALAQEAALKSVPAGVPGPASAVPPVEETAAATRPSTVETSPDQAEVPETGPDPVPPSTMAILRSKASSVPVPSSAGELHAAGGGPVSSATPAAQRRAALGNAIRQDQALPRSSANDVPPASAAAELFSLSPQTGAPGLSANSLSSQPLFQGVQLAAIIDRLGDLRQAAGEGRVQLAVLHQDFGSVGIRLDPAAGAALTGFALTSSDAGFAPAVQAALAERGPSDRQPPGEQTSGRGEQSPRDASAQHGDAQPQHARAQAEDRHARPRQLDGAPDADRAASDAAARDLNPPHEDSSGLYA